MLIDIKTPKEDYLLDPELLNLATNLKSFLREKLAFSRYLTLNYILFEFLL